MSRGRTKSSALDIRQSPWFVASISLARCARLGPLCGSGRRQNSRNDPHSGPMFVVSFHCHQIGSQIVNVAVGVGRQQLSMRLVWITNLDARSVARSRKRALRSISETQDDVEV